MRKVVAVAAACLAAYSALLLHLEGHAGSSFVRLYLEDPPVLVPLAGIHTALSSALLGACALTFAAARRAEGAGGRGQGRAAAFLAMQTAIFAFLAADETLRIVPWLAERLAFPDDGAYLAVGLLEVGLLLGPGELLRAPAAARAAAFAAAALFGVALGMDNAPQRLPFRECLEELPKVWGGALFLAFAWARFDAALDELAFPGVHGAALRWGREGAGTAERRGFAPAPAPASAPARPASGPATIAAPQVKQNGAPVRGTGAPEPIPKSEASGSSAAPPRKLLSH